MNRGKMTLKSSKTPISTTNKPSRKQNNTLIKRLSERWSGFSNLHPHFAAILIALLTCAILWLIFWFLLFSGMNESADFIYSKF
jgi:type II secretory pathway component PulM